MSGQLEIRDSRTGQTHYVTTYPGNYVHANALSKIGLGDGTTAASRGLRILDRGFEHTACMQSDITYIDGQKGAISFRGRSIQDLFHNHDFEQVMHLLIWGDMPTEQRLKDLRQVMADAMVPPQIVVNIIQSYPKDTPVYSLLLAGMTAYTSTDSLTRECQQSLRPTFHGNVSKADQAIVSTLAYYATTLALIYCHRESKTIQAPNPELSMVGNLLHMMGLEDPDLEQLFSKLWILYADHEMTASTAALLHTGATLADPISSLISGITAGYGPLHAGAIQLAYEQLQNIGSVDRIPIFMKAVKAKTTRLFGYGHRVYRARDPRLALIEELMDKHQDRIRDDALLEIARQLEATAEKDEYFIKRNLRANADLKGCFLYTAFGFDTEMTTAIISLSRTAGGLAHWRECQEQSIKIWRPQQIYTGPMSESEQAPTKTEVVTSSPAPSKVAKISTTWKAMLSFPQTLVGLIIVRWYGFNNFGRKGVKLESGIKVTRRLRMEKLD